jgi:uncharacterized protein YegL
VYIITKEKGLRFMKKDYAKIVVVLDRSGSMSSIKNSTIEGFNKFLDSQRELVKEDGTAAGECDISLYQFDDRYEAVYENKDIKLAPKLNQETFVPRGGTALLDAIGKTIDKLGNTLRDLKESNRPEKVIFVIYTDGEENSSKEYNRNTIFDMITHQREKYNWAFVFLGANQDAIATATSYGISAGAAITYGANTIGTTNVYNAMNIYTSGTRCAAIQDVQYMSFTQSDRDSTNI